MSTLKTAREPAWSGAPPGRPDFAHPVSAIHAVRLERILQDRFKLDARLTGRLAPGAGVSGHFLAETQGGKLVLHVKRHSMARESKLSAQIADAAAAAGLNVASYVCSPDGDAEVQLEDGFLTITRFLNGRHGDGSVIDAVSLGRTLAVLHGALREFPLAEDVRLGQNELARRYRSISDRIAREGAPTLLKPDEASLVRRAARRYPQRTAPRQEQCLHGDVSPGNVIFRDGAAGLLDFEDAAFSYGPCSRDVGSAVLRFALATNGSGAKDRRNALILSYRSEGGAVSDEEIDEAILAFIDCSFLSLADAAFSGALTHASERRKFVALAESSGA